MRYFYNSWDSAYKSHFGAIARNQSCQFTIRLPEETPLDFSPVLVVFRTGFKERFLPMNEYGKKFGLLRNCWRVHLLLRQIPFR